MMVSACPLCEQKETLVQRELRRKLEYCIRANRVTSQRKGFIQLSLG